MSQPKPDHPWQTSVVARVGCHSPQFIADVIAALANASSSEVAAAVGLTRNMIIGIGHRAKLSGADVVRKHGRAPGVVTIEKPKPTPKAPITGSRVSKAVLRVVSMPIPVVPVTFGTGTSILDVRVDECRALDDAGDCCCQPVSGGSWCAGHRAIYLRTSTRRAA